MLIQSTRTIGALRLGGVSPIRYVALAILLFHGILQLVLVVLLLFGYLSKPRRGTFYEVLALAIYSAARPRGEGTTFADTTSLNSRPESLYQRRIMVVQEGEEEFMRL